MLCNRQSALRRTFDAKFTIEAKRHSSWQPPPLRTKPLFHPAEKTNQASKLFKKNDLRLVHPVLDPVFYAKFTFEAKCATPATSPAGRNRPSSSLTRPAAGPDVAPATPCSPLPRLGFGTPLDPSVSRITTPASVPSQRLHTYAAPCVTSVPADPPNQTAGDN